MDKDEWDNESQAARLSETEANKARQNLPICQEDWVTRLINEPITQEAFIVNFYYFWVKKAELFVKYYQRYSLEERVQMIKKIFIFQKYCRTYFGLELNYWFQSLRFSMSWASRDLPKMTIKQQQLDQALKQIYRTHDVNFKQPTFPTSKGYKKEGFLSYIMRKIISPLMNKEQKNGGQIQQTSFKKK